jgi:hypothetical protein
MRTLTQAEFIALWEVGRSLHPLDQAVLTLQAAYPEVKDSIADWSIGRRNRALAQLRDAAFATPYRGWTSCRQCGEKLEFELDARGLANGAPAESPVTDARVEVRGEQYRLPTSRDLADVSKDADATSAAQRLLQRCRVGGAAARSQWSEEEIDEIGAHMAEADPLAEIRLSFACPICRTAFEENIDLPAFLWAEMEARAKRMLNEVHLLASAYGWSQSEILGLSAARREFFVGAVRA